MLHPILVGHSRPITLIIEVNATYGATGDLGGVLQFWNINKFSFISMISKLHWTPLGLQGMPTFIAKVFAQDYVFVASNQSETIVWDPFNNVIVEVAEGNSSQNH